MSLERLTRRAIEAHHLDAGTLEKIERFIESRSYLVAEEFEALRSLGKALRSGLVRQGPAESPVL